MCGEGASIRFSWTSAYKLAGTLLAPLILMMVVFPWTPAAYDGEFSGFDPNYMYVEAGGGTVTVKPQELSVTAPPLSRPQTIIASSHASYFLEFDIVVDAQAVGHSYPFQLQVSSPLTKNTVVLYYQSDDRSIVANIERANYTDLTNQRLLGQYQIGIPMHLALKVVHGQQVKFELSNANWSTSYYANRTQAESLLGSSILVTKVSAIGSVDKQDSNVATRAAALRIQLPHDNRYGPRTIDQGATVAYAGISGLLLVRLFGAGLPRFTQGFSTTVKVLKGLPRKLWLVAACSFILHVTLFPLGNHPYDIFSESLWVYTLLKEGLGALYQRPLLVTTASTWGGVPFLDAWFPYSPLMGYYFGAAAIVVAPFGPLATDFAIEFSIKLLNSISNLAGGLLAFLLVRKLGGSSRNALLGATFFLFNPATIYTAALWGQTDAFVSLLLLSAIYFLVSRKPRACWASLALALLSKQTSLIPVAAIAVLSLRRMNFKDNLRGIEAGFIVMFLVLMPFLYVGYSPSIAFTPIISQLELGTQGDAFSGPYPVSWDAYNFPSLVSPFSGVQGRERLAYPDLNLIPWFQISYFAMGLISFLVVSAPMIVKSLRTRGETNLIDALIVGLITLFAFFFLTRTSARYFVVALSLLVPPVFAVASKRLTAFLTIITSTTFLAMHANIALYATWFPMLLPRFDYAHPFNQAAISLFVSDYFITIGILLNLTAVLGLLHNYLQLRAAVHGPQQLWKIPTSTSTEVA